MLAHLGGEGVSSPEPRDASAHTSTFFERGIRA